MYHDNQGVVECVQERQSPVAKGQVPGDNGESKRRLFDFLRDKISSLRLLGGQLHRNGDAAQQG